MLPPVREGSMVDLTIQIDEKATAERERKFQQLQDDIFKIAEAGVLACAAFCCVCALR